MTLVRRHGARSLFIAILAIALLAAGALAWIGRERPGALPPRAPGARPQLMLLTTLPLIFPENFGLEGGGSEALEVLESRYEVVPIGIADAAALASGRLLLMAHPLAQPAEALVDLDAWVRRGGRVLILADPKLDWPSRRPFGDVLRPPPAYADTGLLAHWGLRLDAPDGRGREERTVEGRPILLSSAGTLAGGCAVAGEGLVARCAIGRGRATVIADADLLQPPQASPRQVEGNLQFLLAELARLEGPNP